MTNASLTQITETTYLSFIRLENDSRYRRRYSWSYSVGVNVVGESGSTLTTINFSCQSIPLILKKLHHPQTYQHAKTLAGRSKISSPQLPSTQLLLITTMTNMPVNVDGSCASDGAILKHAGKCGTSGQRDFIFLNYTFSPPAAHQFPVHRNLRIHRHK